MNDFLIFINTSITFYSFLVKWIVTDCNRLCARWLPPVSMGCQLSHFPALYSYFFFIFLCFFVVIFLSIFKSVFKNRHIFIWVFSLSDFSLQLVLAYFNCLSWSLVLFPLRERVSTLFRTTNKYITHFSSIIFHKSDAIFKFSASARLSICRCMSQ